MPQDQKELSLREIILFLVSSFQMIKNDANETMWKIFSSKCFGFIYLHMLK